MRQTPLLCLLFSLLSLSVASSWPDSSPFEDYTGVLVGRKDAESSGKETITTDSSATETGNSGSATTKASGSEKTKETPSKTTDKPSKSTDYDPRLPPGGISMITPAVILGQQFYKIHDFVTFAWNYTSLRATPNHIDVLASCSSNSQTYTLAVNQTVHQSQQILWDTQKYQKENPDNQLPDGMYTLIVYDAASSPSAPAKAGYLASYNNFIFGMYNPLPYQNLTEYSCATCGTSSGSSLERQTVTFLLGMCGITVVTFTFFANSFGLF